MENQTFEKATKTGSEIIGEIITELGGLLIRGIFALIIAGGAIVLMIRLVIPIVIVFCFYLGVRAMFSDTKKKPRKDES